MEVSTTKKMAKNFGWLFVGSVVSGIINFVTMIYIARTLGAASFGLLQFALAFIAYLVIFVDSGLSILGTREIAKDLSRAGDFSLNILIIRFLIAFVVYSLSLVIIWLSPATLEIRLLFTVVFSLIFYRALNADWIFQGLEKMEYIALARVLYSVLSFMLIVILIKTSSDLIKVPLVQSAFGLIVAVIFLFLLFRKFIHISLKDIKLYNWPVYLVQAFPLGASLFLTQIYNSMDTIMLGFMDKPTVVGYYNAAYRIFYVFAGIFNLWLSTAIPTVSERIGRDTVGSKVFLDKFLHLTLLAIIPLTCLIYLSSPLVIGLIFGPEYAEAVLALRVLIWTLIPIAIGSIYGHLILISAGRFNQFFLAVMIGAVVNIVFNFFLIPRFSFFGAAIATILAETAVTFIVIYFSRKVLLLRLSHRLFKPFVISLVSLIAFWAVYILPFAIGFTRLFLSSAVFLAVCLILLVFIEREFISSFVTEVMRRE